MATEPQPGLIARAIGGLFKGVEKVGRGALYSTRSLIEAPIHMGAGLMDKQVPAYASQTIGAKIGTGLLPKTIGATAGLAAGIGMAAGSAAVNVAGLGYGAGTVAAKALFRPMPGNYPLPYKMRTGASWGLGLGAMAYGVGAGIADGAKRSRLGVIYPQGQLNELMYDANPNSSMGSRDMGATGDMVLAMNNLR